MNTPQTIEGYLDHCFERFVRPLLDNLNLRVLARTVEGLGGLYELRGEQMMVRLVNDRGLASVEIASLSDPQDYWDLELVAALFEPPPSRGVQRLNLEEQFQLLRTRWDELNSRFGPVSYAFHPKRAAEIGSATRRSALRPECIWSWSLRCRRLTQHPTRPARGPLVARRFRVSCFVVASVSGVASGTGRAGERGIR